MNKNAKKIIALLAAAAMMVSSISVGVSATTNSTGAVGALADSFTLNDYTYQVSKDSRIFVVSDADPADELLQTVQLIQRQIAADEILGVDLLSIVWGPESWAWSGDIVLKLDSGSGIAAEGYSIAVTDKAVVTASDVDGLLYGVNNLQKHIHYAEETYGSTLINGFTAADAPDTKERTVMLDTGRKYYTVEWICNFIRQISWMGYNALEIHFSEDGGFRADLWDPTYYKGEFQPENDFSWLCGSHVQSWVYDETLPDGTTGKYTQDPDAGKYLTTAELVQICEVAKEYHLEIIPSFDSPAHMDYITWKFEQNYRSNTSYSFTYNNATYKASTTNGCINYTGVTGKSSPTWPHYTTIDITDGTMAKAFVFALYEDMADFFKEYAGSTNFSIGADEVNLTSYSSSYPRTWSYAQFPGYVNDLNRMLNNKGYTVRMFNDFIGSTTYNQSNSKAVYEFDDNIEIMYWNSDFHPTTGAWSEPVWHVKFFWENNTGSSDNWGDGGRTMYNCIQTNCYYVLRIGTSGDSRDARDPDNRNWTFYHSNEESIYNEWYPADISEKGVYTEDAADVPADQLGGAYFLIWNDYAALSTEQEVWNGALDGWDKDVYYSLFNRMYSNIIKMWNSDINDSVTYSAYAAVRDKYDYFPGFTSCSADADLPEATTPTQAYLADHSALEAALANKISNSANTYTAESYAAYETMYTAAETVHADYSATESEINTAISNLQAAEKALVDVTAIETARTELQNAVASKIQNTDGDYTAESYSVYENAYNAALECLSNPDATLTDLQSALTTLNNAKSALVPVVNRVKLRLCTNAGGEFAIRYVYLPGTATTASEIYLERIIGYAYESIQSGYKFVPLASGDGSGYIRGNITAGSTIVVYYTSMPDVSYLEQLIRSADDAALDSNNYTEDSWAAYNNALMAAKSFSVTSTTTQQEIDALADALVAATTSLVVKDSANADTKIISVTKMSASSKIGKKVTLVVTTTPNVNVDSIEITGGSVNNLSMAGKVQTLSTGQTVKVWLVRFSAPSANCDYTITVGTTSIVVPITVYS